MESGDSVALIVGVTGMVGYSLARTLKKARSTWTVYGSSRRTPLAWFDHAVLDRFIQLDALDGESTELKLSPVASRVTHLFWVALAARATEEENIAANSAMMSNVLHALTTGCGSRLRHVALQTGTKHYVGPIIMDPALAGRVGSVDVPFREDVPRYPIPNFYYALEDILASYSNRLTWTVHRSSIIFGASSLSIYNALLMCVAYALICRHEGSPLVYPGTLYTWNHFCDASDADLLAEQQIWATTTPAAAHQAFNCTNGDVFTWKSFWKVMAELFHLELIDRRLTEDVGPEWVEKMKGKGAVWDDIVEKNGLLKTKLEDITVFDAFYAAVHWKFQHVCCMNKSRELGFYRSVDTIKSVRKWVERLRDINIIPKD